MWKPPSTVIHNDKSVIRNTNHIFSAVGVETRHRKRLLVRERQRRVAECVVTETGQIFVDAGTTLAADILRVPYQPWMSVRNSVTSLLVNALKTDLIDASMAQDTKL